MFGDITRIGANFHAMESLANLKRVNGSIGQIQSRLSSGKRINSAEDDTSGYALSKHLQSRVNGLSQSLDNVSTAKNVLNIAEGGYQSQMNILQQIKENLTQAADGALSSDQRGAIGDRIESLLTEFNDIKDQTKYNGFRLFTEGDPGSETDRAMTFQVGEETSDIFEVTFDNSSRSDVGETNGGSEIDLDSIVKSVVYNAQETVAAGESITLSNYTAGDDVAITLPDGTVVSSEYTLTDNSDGTATIAFTAAGTYDIAHTYDSSDTESADWSALTQSEAQAGIDKVDSAIKSLAKSIQNLGDLINVGLLLF